MGEPKLPWWSSSNTRFLNSLIFYDQSGQYAGWALAAVFLSISVLISGVVLLSMKRVENTETQTPVVNLQAPRRQRASSGASSDETAVEREGESQRPVPKDEVMWQVGEDSDSDEEGEDGERSHKGHGVGGTRGDGERGGLLFANEEEDEDHPNEHMRSRARGNSLVRSPAVQPRDSLE